MILNLPPNFLKFHHHSYKLFVYSNGVQTSHEGYFKNYFYFKLVSYFKNALLIMPNGLISNKCIGFYYHMLKISTWNISAIFVSNCLHNQLATYFWNRKTLPSLWLRQYFTYCAKSMYHKICGTLILCFLP